MTYSNEAKVMQGVSSEILGTYGVYSKETAIEMARICRKAYQANIGIGVTGTFGNLDPNNQDSVAGQVYFAIDLDGNVSVFERRLQFRNSRYEYKLAVAEEIVEMLLNMILL